MALGLGNNLIRNGGASNPDKLSLDLQFATDKTLTARKGPTPTFIRASGDNGGTTYFGPSGINVAFSFDGNDYDEAVFQNTVFNGRFRWTSGDISFGYTGTAWALSYDGNNVATSAPTSAFRPDGANWSGTAAVVTATGAFGIVKAANNEPRFDHDPLTLACKGLLIEEQRINQIVQSEDFSTTWSQTQVAILTNATTSPNGLATADKIVPNLASTISRVSQAFTLTGAHSMSVFAKASEWGWVYVGPISGGVGVWFDLSNGTVGTQSSGFVGSISSFGNGWYRCSVSFTGSGTLQAARFVPTNADNTITTGDGTSGIFIWGAQLEAGSFPTSYIPTTTASLARSADVCSITGSAFTNLWNTTGGTFLFEGFLTNYGGINHRMLSSGAARRWLYGNQAGIGTIIETLTAYDGVSTSNYFTNIRIATKFKIAISVEALTCKASFNGSAISTVSHNGNLLTSVTLLGLFESASGYIASVKYYKKNLSNAKLQTLTT